MDEYFATMPVTNATVLCVGSVTRAETERAKDDGLEIDGTGYYANATAPREPIQLLAKFFSEFEAGRFARMLAVQTV